MNVTAAKKVGLFLSIILMHGSAFGMDLGIQKKLTNLHSAIVRSDRNKLFVAATIPIVVAGGFLVAKYKDDILQAVENVEGKTVIGGVVAVATVPAVYGGMQMVITPEMKLQAHNDWLEKEKETNVLLQQQNEIQKIFDGEQLALEKQAQLQNIVNTHFATNAHNEYPVRTAIKLCNKLEIELQKGQELEKKMPKLSDDPSGLTKNGAAIMFVKKFRAALVNLPEYKDGMHKASGEKKNKQKKDQFTWTNKYASIVSAFTSLFQPMGTVLALWLQAYLFPQQQ